MHSEATVARFTPSGRNPTKLSLMSASAPCDPHRLTRQTFRLAGLPFPDPVHTLLAAPNPAEALPQAFALRSPVSPNPIGTQLVRLLAVEGSILLVRGLDCLDGTPLIDLKPDRCAYTPVAPRRPGEDAA